LTAVAQRLADHACDRLEDGREAAARAHGLGDVQEPPQLGERGGFGCRRGVRGGGHGPSFIGGERADFSAALAGLDAVSAAEAAA
jgi:hypothetical protein